MIWALALAVWACVSAGLYLALSRDLLRCVLGLALLGSGANLVLFASARVAGDVPAVVPAGATTLAAAATNPLPQALVLTAIVIGFALLCFSLVLVLRLVERGGSDDAHSLRHAEPPPLDPLKPPLPAPELQPPAQGLRGDER